MNGKNTWHESVPDASQFEKDKKENIEKLSKNSEVRRTGLKLLLEVNASGFGHKNSWLGAPIIRLPEDLMFQQEVISKELPDLIIEIGVARGGGLLYNASIQEICGITPKVIGVDNKIYEHTKRVIEESRYSKSINLIEGDSISNETVSTVRHLSSKSKKILLVLDSDHSSSHVLSELQKYIPILPINSIVMVCDTLIDELPEGTYPNRTWSNGKGPLDAINIFTKETSCTEPFMEMETKALIFSEIRKGMLRKVSN